MVANSIPELLPRNGATIIAHCQHNKSSMPLALIALDGQPGRFAVTKVSAFVPDGRFFLDFTRELEVIRWLGIRNRYIGPAVGLFVPVAHEAENAGRYVIGISVGEPFFHDVRKLWKTYFPTAHTVVAATSGLKVIADFATQFPEDA